MDEKILVRIDEETPSDEKMAVRLVEVKHLNPEFSEKLDVLDRKLDALAEIDSGVEALTEIKNLLSDFNSSIRALESKPVQNNLLQELSKVNEHLESVNNKLNTDQVLFEIAKTNVQLESVREKLNKDTMPVELNKISELLATMTNSLNDIDSRYSNIDNKLDANNVTTSGLRYDMDNLFTLIENKHSDLENKYNDIDVNLVSSKLGQSDIRNDINELSSSLNDIYNSVESLKGVNARDNAEIDSIKGMARDATLSLDALLRKNDSISESIVLTANDREIMEGRIRSELETIQNMLTGLSASGNVDTELLEKLDGIRKSVSATTSKAARNQTRIDKSIKDFNAYLTRLNSIDYMLRLLQAKNLLKTKRRLPKWAREKKKSIEALISAIEDEVADIMIVNAIPKEGLDAKLLSKAIGRTRKKTMERLVQLMASGYVDERKVKRKKFYFLIS